MNESKKCILHVEDDIHVQEFMNTLLSGVACIDAADTLSEAKSLLHNNHYDLIMVDFTLPDGSGSELISYLAKHNPSIPIIVFSAHEISNSMVNVKHIFMKGRFSPQILLDTVSGYLINTH